jgi:NAD-reducing hydrogenase small subunit
MSKPRLATCSLTGCFGCHMSLLDIDERLLELMDLADLDRSPLDDKKEFDRSVDVGFIEGG